jgi:hypothetical protein
MTRTPQESDTTRDVPVRRPYRTPQLKEYGPVSKLTMSGTGSKPEPGGAMKRTCL